MIGQTFDHHRITAAIGAGGMGEAYRATDTNLRATMSLARNRGPESREDPAPGAEESDGMTLVHCHCRTTSGVESIRGEDQ